ncbi:MAG: HAD family hydrolase [Planctomycetes bacterium]|nr:HAD family hydrolase [Planctomycetota bacterium]
MKSVIKAVVFDMDGTITVPVLDFSLIKAEIGVAGDRPLLESVLALDGAERAGAEAILLRHELRAAHDSRLNEGVAETLGALRAAGLKTAILTRNCRVPVDIVLEKHDLHFDAIVTREDSLPKPNPDGLHKVSGIVGVDAEQCIMVGDYEFDILVGHAAGAITVLYAPQGHSFQTVPDFEIRSMLELVGLVRILNEG